MRDRIRRMSWLLPTLLVGALAISLLVAIVVRTSTAESRAESVHVALLEQLAQKRALALGQAGGDAARSQTMLQQAIEFPRVLDALLWRSDGTLVSRAVQTAAGAGAPDFRPPQTRAPAVVVPASGDRQTAGSNGVHGTLANLWHPVTGTGFDGWLQLVVEREQVDNVYLEHLLQVALMSTAVGLLVWLCVLGVTRRTREALEKINRFALELDGSGRQLAADPRNLELHGLVDALNQASLRLSEQQRVADINERELRALTGNIPGVVYRCLADSRMTMEYLSQEFERLTGYPVVELIENRTRSYASIVHPSDTAKMRGLIGSAIEQRRPFAAEYRLRAADGSTRWVLDKGQGVFNERGEFLHLTGVIINDTARHSAIIALARSEARHRRLVENLSEVVWQSDTEARVSFVNRAWLQVTGHQPEELVGRRLFERIAQADRPAAVRAWRRMLSGIDGVAQWQARIETASGELRWGEFTARLTVDADGKTNGVAGLLSDINERTLLAARLREGEERLRESLELSRQLLEAMPHPVYYKDRNGRFQSVNRAWETFYGRGRDTVVGRTSSDLWPSQLSELIELRDRELLEGSAAYQAFEAELTNAAGEQRAMLFSKAVLTSSSQERTGLIGVLTDITSNRNTEAELRKLSLVASRTSNAVVITDADGHIEWVNDAFTRLTGIPAAEAIGHVPGHLLQGPETDPATVARMRRHLAAREGFQEELINYTRDGRLYWVALDVQPIRGENGEVQQFIAVKSDITERKLREEALRASEAKARQLAQVVDQASEAIMLKDLDNRLIAWNRGAEQLYQFTEAEVLGRSAYEVLRIAETGGDETHAMERVRTGRNERMSITRRLRKDGSSVDVELSLSPLFDPEGRHIGEIGVARDISERLRYEAELKAAKDAAEAASQAKGAFLANMSHEIRTPMNGIIGMTELALDTDLDAEQRDYLTSVRRSAENLLQVINDVLDYSKIEAGRIQLEQIGFSLRAMLSDRVKSLAPKASERSLQMILDVAPDVPDALVGDPLRIGQVILNLVGNAIKFTQIGEIVVSAEVVGPCTEGGPVQVRFRVRDTGIGIAPQKQEQIFEAFTQADSSTTRRFGGTGLGLSISRHLVSLMGSELRVQSAPGEGSTFWFDLSLLPDTIGLGQPVVLRPLRVLLVDGSASSRRSLAHLFAHWGMALTECQSIDEARYLVPDRAALEAGFDLVLVHAMPALLIEQAVSTWIGDRVPLVVVAPAGSARASDPAWTPVGAAAVLVQPVTASDLFETIGRHMALPDDPSTPAAVPQPPVPQQTAALALDVLLAEDNPVNRKLARMLLERAGHRVTVANDGVEAVEAWSRGEFDIVLMDVQMPRLGGLEATARIRALERERNAAADGMPPRHTPIVALTAHAMIGDEERCLAAGMDGYLSKPLRRERLAVVLDQFALAKDGNDAAQRGRAGHPPVGFPAIDTNALLHTVGGDRQLLAHLCSMCLESLPGMQDRLRAAVETGCAPEIVTAAHALRGVILNFHARPSVEALATLERTAIEGSPDALGAGYRYAASEVERAAAALREAVAAMA
ncbi:MAG: PAS domain S-box protein [Betaproteobacteria bacterium]|nr:PAS domain S-box protein [Betaproteobacteria bacterium]